MLGAGLESAGLEGWSSYRVKDFSNIKQRAPCGGKVVRCTGDRENLSPLGPSNVKFTEIRGGGMNS
jgi:hypothetical protein